MTAFSRLVWVTADYIIIFRASPFGCISALRTILTIYRMALTYAPAFLQCFYWTSTNGCCLLKFSSSPLVGCSPRRYSAGLPSGQHPFTRRPSAPLIPEITTTPDGHWNTLALTTAVYALNVLSHYMCLLRLSSHSGWNTLVELVLFTKQKRTDGGPPFRRATLRRSGVENMVSLPLLIKL